MAHPMDEMIELANLLADEAGEIVRHYFRKTFDIDSKQDESPVTVADKSIELRLREIIEAERPDDGILGEEFERKYSNSGYTWVLDPIDGTKPFIAGRPSFGTLIALCHQDVPVLGVIDQAVTKDRWVGAKGRKTTWNGKEIQVRNCETLKEAVCACTRPDMFLKVKKNFIEEWRQKVRFIVWGGDCLSYGYLSSGMVDVVIEADLEAFDYLAFVPIVEGAGGKISDWEGNPLTINSGDKVIAVGDAELWDSIQNSGLFE